MSGDLTHNNHNNIVIRKLCTALLMVNKPVWDHLPGHIKGTQFFRFYGRMLHSLVVYRAANRVQNPWTYFHRNPAEIDLIHDIVSSKPADAKINIVVLACSVGMEVYSIKWRLRKLAHNVNIIGLELSESSLAIAKKGEYPLDKFTPHFERLSDNEFNRIFSVKDNVACIRPELKKDIRWLVGNACNPELAELLGKQDIVLANRFLCHMYPSDAENCLHNIKKIIAPGGYLFVSGVDLDVRENVMHTPDFTPVRDRLEDIHNGDYTLHAWWPWHYSGLEPIPKNFENHLRRYAMVYKRNEHDVKPSNRKLHTPEPV